MPLINQIREEMKPIKNEALTGKREESKDATDFISQRMWNSGYLPIFLPGIHDIQIISDTSEKLSTSVKKFMDIVLGSNNSISLILPRPSNKPHNHKTQINQEGIKYRDNETAVPASPQYDIRTAWTFNPNKEETNKTLSNGQNENPYFPWLESLKQRIIPDVIDVLFGKEFKPNNVIGKNPRIIERTEDGSRKVTVANQILSELPDNLREGLYYLMGLDT